MAENIDNEEISKIDSLYLKRIKAQRLIVERYLNACLFERIQGESRFKGLRKVLPLLSSRFETSFTRNFQSDMFVSEAQILRKFHFEFLPQVL